MINCQSVFTFVNCAQSGGANVVHRSNLLSVLGKLVIWRSSSSAARHKAPSTPPHSLASLQPPSQPPQPDPCEYLRGFLGVGKKLSLVGDACSGLEFNVCVSTRSSVRTSAVAITCRRHALCISEKSISGRLLRWCRWERTKNQHRAACMRAVTQHNGAARAVPPKDAGIYLVVFTECDLGEERIQLYPPIFHFCVHHFFIDVITRYIIVHATHISSLFWLVICQLTICWMVYWLEWHGSWAWEKRFSLSSLSGKAGFA